jgi:nucleotide-binding universal stress UspA family protein
LAHLSGWCERIADSGGDASANVQVTLRRASATAYRLTLTGIREPSHRAHNHGSQVRRPRRQAPAQGRRKYEVFSKILVPLDGTPEAAVALTPARTVAEATGAAVCLLTVIDADAPEEDYATSMSELEGVAAELRTHCPRVETAVRRGAPATEIVAATIEVGADLVAMSTHGRSGLERAFLGSVTQDVLAASPVPVLLLRPGGHQMTKLDVVLVPIDGSPGGAVALASAIPLARSVNARLVLLDVAVPFVAYMVMSESLYSMGSLFAFDPAWDEETLGGAQRYVSGMAERLRDVGLQADGMVTTGGIQQPVTSVAEAIMRTADEVGADLIVMSTHALTGPARALLGSVADMVVRNAHRPVLLPRRRARDEAADGTGDLAEPTGENGAAGS